MRPAPGFHKPFSYHVLRSVGREEPEWPGSWPRAPRRPRAGKAGGGPLFWGASWAWVWRVDDWDHPRSSLPMTDPSTTGELPLLCRTPPGGVGCARGAPRAPERSRLPGEEGGLDALEPLNRWPGPNCPPDWTGTLAAIANDETAHEPVVRSWPVAADGWNGPTATLTPTPSRASCGKGRAMRSWPIGC